MQHSKQSTSRRAPRVAYLLVVLALAGCADLGFPTEPAYFLDDPGATRCAADGVGRADRREGRRVERVRCSGVTRGSAQPPATK